jgi:IS5 family transposase
MKQKTFYIILPIVALVAFTAYYMHFRDGYEQVVAAKAAAVEHEKQAEIARQNVQRQKAIDEALVAQERHKVEKAAKEVLKTKRADERQTAFQAREKSFQDRQKFRDDVEKYQKDVVTVKEEIAKIKTDKGVLENQKRFLQESVVKAEANAKSLAAVLDKISAADAAAAAVRAAALAAKKTE